MTLLNRILSVFLSFCLLALVLMLVKSKKLKEKYALLWLATGTVILMLAVFNKMLYFIVAMLGIKMPINGVLFLGIFFIIIINLHFSVVISKLSEQNKILGQKLALLEENKTSREKIANESS